MNVPVVDLLLNGPRGEQAVDGDLPLLPDPPRPLPGLWREVAV